MSFGNFSGGFGGGGGFGGPGGAGGGGGRRFRESTEGASINWSVARRVLGYTRPYARHRNVVAALTVLRALQRPALVWLLAEIINGPISRGDYRGAVLETVAYGLLLLITAVVFHYRQHQQMLLGESIIHDLRNDVFENVQRMPLSYFHKTKLGRILNRVISDIEMVRRGMQQVFFFSILAIGQMVAAAGLMLYYNWALFLLLLGVGPLVWLTNRHFHPRLSRLSRAAAESSSRLTGSLAESIRGIRVIQSFTRQARGQAIYDGLSSRLAEDNVSLTSKAALYAPLLDLSGQLFTSILLVVGGYGALHGFAGLDLGSLVAFLFLPALFFQSLQQIGNLYTQAISSMAGAERVFQLIDLKPEWEDAPEAVDLPDPRSGFASADFKSPIPNLESPALGARVELRGVVFGYDPARPVLHDLSLLAEPGRTIALVGHTGSGKSTIVSLVSKFYVPGRGQVLIDGHDLRLIRAESLRRQMGIVHQNNYLFSGSVRENIRFGRPDASDADIIDVARRLDCLDLIESLPLGFDTDVGEGGAALSLGQRQLVCFARALIADPRLLILDEATSAVDPATEHRLQRALARLLAGRTSIVVAHRLSTIVRADQIIVLDQGRVVERGTHAALLARRGKYRALYREFVIAGLDGEGRASPRELAAA